MFQELIWDLQNWYDDTTSHDYRRLFNDEWAHQTEGMSRVDIWCMIITFFAMYSILLGLSIWLFPQLYISTLLFTAATVQAVWIIACLCGNFLYMFIRYTCWAMALLLRGISRLLVMTHRKIISLDTFGTEKLAQALRDIENLRQERNRTFLLNTKLSGKFEKLRKEQADLKKDYRDLKKQAAIRTPPVPRDERRIPECRAHRFREKYYVTSETQTVVEELPPPSQPQPKRSYIKAAKVSAIKSRYVDSSVQTSVKTTTTFTQTTEQVQTLQPPAPPPPPPPSPSLPSTPTSNPFQLLTTAFQTIERQPVRAKAKKYASTSVQTTGTKYASTSVQTISTASKEAGVQTETIEDVAKELLASQAERLTNEVQYHKDESASLRMQAAALQTSMLTLESQKGQLQAHLQLLQTTNSNLALTSATNAELTNQLLDLRTQCQGASARYDTMKAAAETHAAENTSLKQLLQAAQAAVAGSPSAEAVQAEVEKMQAEFTRQLEMKGRDIERVRAAGRERLDACQTRAVTAEKEAKGANALRQENAVLKLKLGRTPGGKVPEDGRGKNVKKVEEGRYAAMKSLTDWKKHCEINMERLMNCNQDRLKAVERLAEVEREFAKFRRTAGQGPQTVFVATSAEARAGRKREADVEDEEEDEEMVVDRKRDKSPRKRVKERNGKGDEGEPKWDVPK